jgi:UDP-glucose 4-epimerase
MADQRVILITGVSKYWGRSVARGILETTRSINENGNGNSRPFHVIGLDIEKPEGELKGLDFILADFRSPAFVDLLKSENVHTVCHLDFRFSHYRSEKSFDYNVLGTMKVVGACFDSGVKKLILKSSTSVYGAYPQNPAFLTEDHDLQGTKNLGYLRDLVETASFCLGYCRQTSEMIINVLRFPSIIGTRSDSILIRYLNQPVAPVLMGFNPMFQIIHEDDVVGSILHAIQNDYRGAFNVAADGVMPLHRLIRLAGRVPVPIIHPIAYFGARFRNASRLPVKTICPFDWDYLRYTWVADTSRMREIMKFEPLFSAEEAARSFNQQTKIAQYKNDKQLLQHDDQYLRDIIEFRNKQRKID